MARVKVEAVIDHLSSEFRKALEAAVRRQIPGAQMNTHQLYRDFLREVGRKCSTWERVPSGSVEAD